MSTDFILGLQCVLCGKVHSTDVPYTCPDCGVEGILDVLYDYEKMASTLNPEVLRERPLNHWRYRELLPIRDDSPVPLMPVGWTPLVEAPRLAEWVGLRALWLKDDGRNPTASLKDRASSVGVVRCVENGYDTIACASTGNAASSLAGMAASVGLKSYIFVPERAPEPKVTQLLIFGAHVVKVKGTYGEAYDLCMAACERWNWYNRNCAINPYLVEGKKTCGLELAEQFKENSPQWIVVSVGDGCTIAGIWKGWVEMHTLGFIPRRPRLLGVQAEGAQPVVRAFFEHTDVVPTPVSTLADSIAVGTPRNWRKALRAVEDSHGTMIAVSDDEILEAMCVTARLGGVFGEPAAVAGVAGLKRAVAQGMISKNETAAVIITGNGLKDVQSARRAAGEPVTIPPDMGALAAALRL